jgi:adenylosuccinate lyase
MLFKLRNLIEQLQVYPDNMARNLGLTKGLYHSQAILLALTRAGANRQAAYEAVQRAATRTWQGQQSFAENAKQEPEISARLSAAEIDALCSLEIHFRHLDETFRALGLE